MKDSIRLPLVITGHVDHGKSTLIGRLLFETGALQEGLINEIKANLKGTGIKMEFAHIMDYFEEERRQARTIDTTQFFFHTKKRAYVIIDTPGHKEFMKNMMTGSSQAQAAILIISAKEGIEEQTRRHAYVLKLLGIKNIILAINKMDAVTYSQERFNEIVKSAEDLITRLNIQPDRIVPISAQAGDTIAKKSKNMPWYRGRFLLEVLDGVQFAQGATIDMFRFPVQDVYSQDGETIFVGNIAVGTIRVNDEITIVPGSQKARVQSIKVFGGQLKQAEAGRSIGITTKDPVAVERGQVFVKGERQPLVSARVNAHIFWLAQKPFQIDEALRIKCATFEDDCSIERITERVDSSTLEVLERDSSTLEETQVGKATISIASPMVMEDFNVIEDLGRFVLLKDEQVCAGGIITT